MKAMDRSELISYDFFGSGEDYDGIVHADTTTVFRFLKAPFHYYGRFMWQPAAVQVALFGKYDALIMLADPNFSSTWAASLIAKLKHTPVLFWGHGWLKPEGRLKGLVRKMYFKLSKRLLIYAERGKALGISAGFSPDRITVVYNSLDVDRANAIISRIESGALDTIRPQSLFPDPNRKLLICTARLTEKCRFDLLFNAAYLLEDRGFPVNILLVGDGPERSALEALAARLGVTAHFFGACYEEEITGQLIYRSDLTVSPGKIGLTAMHSLMYGTPAITHDDLNEQMPEVEAIEEGRTGAFFERNNMVSLADAIERWLLTAPSREEVRTKARSEVRTRWMPDVQAKIIEDSILQVVRNA